MHVTGRIWYWEQIEEGEFSENGVISNNKELYVHSYNKVFVMIAYDI
jgi:hypothetical protein